MSRCSTGKCYFQGQSPSLKVHEGNRMYNQMIQAERNRLKQHKLEIARQYDAVQKYLDDQLGTLDDLEARANRPLPTLDLSFLSAPAPTAQVITPIVLAPEPEVAPVEATPPAAETGSTDESEQDATPPSGVELGRGGKPRLTEGMRYVLETYGPLHPTDIAKKIIENGLSPNSSNLVDYIRYTLSKNKALFAKVPGQRGMWQAAKGAVSTAQTNSPAQTEEGLVDDDSSLGGQTTEMAAIDTFREKLRVGTVKLSPEEAKTLVDQMSDPRKRMKEPDSLTSDAT